MSSKSASHIPLCFIIVRAPTLDVITSRGYPHPLPLTRNAMSLYVTIAAIQRTTRVTRDGIAARESLRLIRRCTPPEEPVPFVTRSRVDDGLRIRMM